VECSKTSKLKSATRAKSESEKNELKNTLRADKKKMAHALASRESTEAPKKSTRARTKKGDTRVRKQRGDRSEGEKSKLKNATRARSESEKMRTAKQFARGRKNKFLVVCF
jgi:hypothetical protein